MSRRWVAVLVVVACVLAACGGGEVSLTQEASRSESEVVATATPAAGGPTSGPTETATPAVSEGDDPEPTSGATPTPLASPTAIQSPTTPAVPSGTTPAETIGITYSSVGPGAPAVEAELIAHRDGSFRFVSAGGTEVQVFDARTGIEASWFVPEDGDPFASSSIGHGLGGPDPTPWFWLPGSWFAPHVVSLGDAAGLEVVEVLDRPAYRLDTAVTPNAIGGGPDRVEVIVDIETGMVLTYRGWEGASQVVDVVAQSVEVFDSRVGDYGRDDAPIALGEPWDAGFFEADLGDVESMVGYAPLVPDAVPAGYELSAVRVQPGTRNGYTGAEASNPVSTDVVQLRYANGWRDIVVTTRRVVDGPDSWIDPFSGEGQHYDTELFRLTDGVFAFAAAEVAVAPETTPHLWAVDDDLVLTINGPIGAEAMLEMAQSLAPR